LADSATNYLRTLADRIVGLPCWSVICGKGTGSHFTIRVGRKIASDRPLTNPALTPDERVFEGEFWLFVEDAAWRLDDSNGNICGSTSTNSAGSAMSVGLARLIGQHVIASQVSSPCHDLEFSLSNDLYLRIFCDQLEESDNYSIGGHGIRAVTVGPKGRVEIEAHL
jgi:hypothetical protein